MNIINVTVRGKMARAEERARVVCGNSDYAVRFDFDEEWEAYDLKTARFVTEGGSYTDVQFEGDTCTVPILANTRTLQVGVYAGNLRTTTAALIHALPCVTDPDGTPADPAPDVYNQLMDRLNDLETIDPAEIGKAVKDYLTEHPIEETDPTVPAWAKQPQKPTYTAAEIGAATKAGVTAAVNGAWTQAMAKLEPMFDSKQDKLNITNATAGQIPQITAVDASGVPTAWGAVDLPSGGGGDEWVKLYDDTINIPDEVSEIEAVIPRSDTAKELRLWLRFEANTGTDWGGKKLIDVSINGMRLGYYVVEARLNTMYQIFAVAQCAGLAFTSIIQSTVSLFSNRTNAQIIINEYTQNNNGKIKISLGAPYVGAVTVLLWGRY